MVFYDLAGIHNTDTDARETGFVTASTGGRISFPPVDCPDSQTKQPSLRWYRKSPRDQEPTLPRSVSLPTHQNDGYLLLVLWRCIHTRNEPLRGKVGP